MQCASLSAEVLQVREALEYTRAYGIRFKPPRSRAGRRDIARPDILIDALREHRKEQLETRMKLGLGRLPDDALLFADLVTISKRLGHAKLDITLRIYAHVFRKDDSKAVAAINATMPP